MSILFLKIIARGTAIGDIDPNSTAGPEGVSAKFLRETKDSIAVPLAKILRNSIDKCEIPDILKLAYVTPIHKGGSRLNPENYRPVSLTSHIMKVFERVIKIKLTEHLRKEGLINKGQHGFVEGRSTQTQLLDHFWVNDFKSFHTNLQLCLKHKISSHRV